VEVNQLEIRSDERTQYVIECKPDSKSDLVSQSPWPLAYNRRVAAETLELTEGTIYLANA
jgi:hypothetical protein